MSDETDVERYVQRLTDGEAAEFRAALDKYHPVGIDQFDLVRLQQATNEHACEERPWLEPDPNNPGWYQLEYTVLHVWTKHKRYGRIDEFDDWRLRLAAALDLAPIGPSGATPGGEPYGG